MWADAQTVCLAYARTVVPEAWLVQSKLPADWVTRSATGLLVVKVGASPSPLDSRFDYLTHTIDVDAYVPAGGRPTALAVIWDFKNALVTGAFVEDAGLTAEPPQIVTAPFEFPTNDVPAGVVRVTAAFRAPFSL